jgi:hypothetical protein
LGVRIKLLIIFDVISSECHSGHRDDEAPRETLGGTEHVITRISERWYEKAAESKNLACENFKVKLKEKSRGFYFLTR